MTVNVKATMVLRFLLNGAINIGFCVGRHELGSIRRVSQTYSAKEIKIGRASIQHVGNNHEEETNSVFLSF